MKKQPKQLMHMHSATEQKKFKQPSARKLMGTRYCHKKGVVIVELIQ
jgi:hypothetical protein